jgi:hypothetical protein
VVAVLLVPVLVQVLICQISPPHPALKKRHFEAVSHSRGHHHHQ